ncbi:MAG: hypothetical protein QXO71_08250, partial [Candidatus Jordarchaeaceae archaeon]
MARLIDSGLEQVRSMLIRMGDLAHNEIFTSLQGYVDGVSTYLEVQKTSDILVSTADEAEDKVFELIA